MYLISNATPKKSDLLKRYTVDILLHVFGDSLCSIQTHINKLFQKLFEYFT